MESRFAVVVRSITDFYFILPLLYDVGITSLVYVVNVAKVNTFFRLWRALIKGGKLPCVGTLMTNRAALPSCPDQPPPPDPPESPALQHGAKEQVNGLQFTI